MNELGGLATDSQWERDRRRGEHESSLIDANQEFLNSCLLANEFAPQTDLGISVYE